MSAKLEAIRSEFISKQKQLEEAGNILKKEFFGIDKAIDDLINNTRSWYVLNEYQNRPLVINLWGLTGVGKTSLVLRLAELLDYDDRLFRFDLGSKSGNYSFRSGIEDLCEKNEHEALIVVLDEFQHNRTLKGLAREEVESGENRRVWDLIDSGKIEYYQYYTDLYDLMGYVKKLTYLLNTSIVVEYGRITKGLEAFKAEFEKERNWNDTTNDNLLIKKLMYPSILELAGDSFGFFLLKDIENHLLKLNGPETLMFLKKVIKIAKKPKIKNFTKSLIFVIGNLDEAYSMSQSLTADVNADVFYESSLKITIPQIKNALANRFRKEQISRLGNIHIIYPSLNKEAYRTIISRELQKIAEKTSVHLGLKIEFESSVIDLIYKEGVFPTQGVRPLLTTINYVIKTNLSLFFTEILIQDIRVSKLTFFVKDKELVCNYIFKRKVLHQQATAILTPLEDIRKPKKDDLQAITAVHESGHAIISAILLRTVPEHICSVTTNNDSNGFTYTKFPWNYLSKKEIVCRVAFYLGGQVAEELIFGKDNITAGSSSDVQLATKFLSNMYKTHGLGKLPLYYDLDPNNNSSFHDYEEVETMIEATLKEGHELARETLKKEMNLLLIMSDYLSDYSSLDKQSLKQMILEHKVSDVELLEHGDLLYYRNHLKKTIAKQEESSGLFEGVSLNYQKKMN